MIEKKGRGEISVISSHYGRESNSCMGDPMMKQSQRIASSISVRMICTDWQCVSLLLLEISNG